MVFLVLLCCIFYKEFLSSCLHWDQNTLPHSSNACKCNILQFWKVHWVMMISSLCLILKTRKSAPFLTLLAFLEKKPFSSLFFFYCPCDTPSCCSLTHTFSSARAGPCQGHAREAQEVNGAVERGAEMGHSHWVLSTHPNPRQGSPNLDHSSPHGLLDQVIVFQVM